jgi:hypothetical protein
MAVNNDPNYPTNIISSDLHRIDREWCIGDSLIAINNNTVKLDNRVTALEAKFPIVTIDITNNAVTSEKIRPSAGWSVLGQSLSSLNNPGDIIANVNGDVLRRSNNTLNFGTIGGNSIDNSSIEPGKLSIGAPFWNTSGSVSIGTTSVLGTLGVQGAANAEKWLILAKSAGTANDSGIYASSTNDITFGLRTSAGALNAHLGTTSAHSSWVALTHNFGVGTNAPAARLHVSGQILATDNITAFYSDERLKDFAGRIPNALDKVNLLSGYYFKGNNKAKEFGFDNDKMQVGVRAQEVEKVLPEIVDLAPFDTELNENKEKVSKSGENYKTVQYEKLIPVLIEAIKELSEEIKILKQKINN